MNTTQQLVDSILPNIHTEYDYTLCAGDLDLLHCLAKPTPRHISHVLATVNH